MVFLRVEAPRLIEIEHGSDKGLSLRSHFDRIVIHVGTRLIVTMPGSSFKAVYHKPANQPQLVAKQTPSGTHEFRAAPGGRLVSGRDLWGGSCDVTRMSA